MLCSKCGAQNSEDASFCQKCGEKIAVENRNQQTIEETAAVTPGVFELLKNSMPGCPAVKAVTIDKKGVVATVKAKFYSYFVTVGNGAIIGKYINRLYMIPYLLLYVLDVYFISVDKRFNLMRLWMREETALCLIITSICGAAFSLMGIKEKKVVIPHIRETLKSVNANPPQTVNWYFDYLLIINLIFCVIGVIGLIN